MFDQLSERLQGVLSDVRSRGKLSDEDVSKALREVRLALLEADVNFKVVKDFTAALKDRLAGEEVSDALNPGQTVVKAVNDELTALMGGAGRDLVFAPSGPTVILMAGLQGSGKTTACAKLAKLLRQQNKNGALADGVLITKLDGDARGGAALSVRAVTGKPIIYGSTGEKLDELERFHPDRMASRILGMGDVMSLIEKTQEEFDEDQAADLEQKIRKQQFTLEDFLQQMKQVRRMGPLGNLMKMVPGMGKAMRGMGQVDERELDRIEAIILSMTPHERAHPSEINGSRRKRIATGSGTTVQAVNRLVKQFGQMNRLMKQLSEGKMPDPQQLMRGMR